MPPGLDRIAFVVATKDRPAELARLLRSLAAQDRRPDEVIIVDGGEAGVDDVAARPEFTSLNIRYERCLPPSAARQRNRGLALVSPGIDLIGFLDDDAVLAPGAMGKMAAFWKSAPADVGGAQFNMANHPPVFAAGLKRLPLVSRLGLYSGRPGDILPSGFQVMVGPVRETLFVHWLGSGASIWRRSVFAADAFDEWFEGYSYLEDLDFSYRVGRHFRLAVVGGADYEHLPAGEGRGSGFRFGRREAVNRLYFVTKNAELSRLRCLLTLSLRLGISLAMAGRERKFYYLARAAGTLVGAAQGLIIFSRREIHS
jgi:glycosyltransferase involved in cell wall biosynthesis